MPRRTSTSPTGRSGTRATSSPEPAGSSDPSAGASTDQSQSAFADPSAADAAQTRRPVPRLRAPAFRLSVQDRVIVLEPGGERSALRARVQALAVDSVTRALR